MSRLGLMLDNYYPLGILQAAAQAAEETGYEIFWLPEGEGGKETPSILATLAQSTSTIQLGTGILTIYTRPAVLIAQVAASLTEITGERFVLGLGVGHGPALLQEHSITISRPFQRMRDYVQVVRQALAHGSMSYRGDVVTVPEMTWRFPTPKGPVPIYLAALGPRMAALAGEIGDGVLFNLCPLEYLKEAVGRVKDGALGAGRDPSQVDVACLALTCVGDSSGEEVCRRRIATYIAMPFYQHMLRLSGFGEDVDRVAAALNHGGAEHGHLAVSDRLLDALVVAGDPGTWRDRLSKFHQVGVSLVCLYPSRSGPDAGQALLKDIRALAKFASSPGA